MDRFDFLKYSILFEEMIKKKIIQKVNDNELVNVFENIESWYNWSERVIDKLETFGKSHSNYEEIIFHCSANDLKNLFVMMKYSFKKEIHEETFLKDIIKKTGKISSALVSNKLVRDYCAHPTLDLENRIKKMTNFVFLGNGFGDNLERVDMFYNLVKNSL